MRASCHKKELKHVRHQKIVQHGKQQFKGIFNRVLPKRGKRISENIKAETFFTRNNFLPHHEIKKEPKIPLFVAVFRLHSSNCYIELLYRLMMKMCFSFIFLSATLWKELWERKSFLRTASINEFTFFSGKYKKETEKWIKQIPFIFLLFLLQNHF